MDTFRDYSAKYPQAGLNEMVEVARRQRAKDEVLTPMIRAQLLAGPVLDLGSGCGQVASILRRDGVDVLGSDYFEFFVDYLRTAGVPAIRVDAFDILRYTEGKTFSTIISQGVQPLAVDAEDGIDRCYRSVAAALAPGGRFVYTLPNAMGRQPGASTIAQHRKVLAAITELRELRCLRNQVLPSRAYEVLPRIVSMGIERLLGRWLGQRFVLVLERQ